MACITATAVEVAGSSSITAALLHSVCSTAKGVIRPYLPRQDRYTSLNRQRRTGCPIIRHGALAQWLVTWSEYLVISMLFSPCTRFGTDFRSVLARFLSCFFISHFFPQLALGHTGRIYGFWDWILGFGSSSSCSSYMQLLSSMLSLPSPALVFLDILAHTII